MTSSDVEVEAAGMQRVLYFWFFLRVYSRFQTVSPVTVPCQAVFANLTYTHTRFSCANG